MYSNTPLIRLLLRVASLGRWNIDPQLPDSSSTLLLSLSFLHGFQLLPLTGKLIQLRDGRVDDVDLQGIIFATSLTCSILGNAPILSFLTIICKNIVDFGKKISQVYVIINALTQGTLSHSKKPSMPGRDRDELLEKRDKLAIFANLIACYYFLDAHTF